MLPGRCQNDPTYWDAGLLCVHWTGSKCRNGWPGVGLVEPERTEDFWVLLFTKLIGLSLLAAFIAALASKMVSDHRASTRAYKDTVSSNGTDCLLS